uniref:Antitoxin n=1 Tax=Candidatus Kentrum sp. MB TaxID=2138164 RepID=A0A450XCX7_9GAMM|nr:MAG: prevent-host-death family protein [Candidatus Kentron sp. MB]VFK31432.1 MAG: prevent-host-death family protein [Candidatus Kentron sp. MB]VFK75481.1 MAG: prevent-host-death family protein [Candidatus Kentron sp. MB]
MQTVDLHEAKARFPWLVEQACAGHDVLIARAGKPVARLTRLEIESPKPRALGLCKGRFRLPEDFSDLHADTIQRMFETGA